MSLDEITKSEKRGRNGNGKKASVYEHEHSGYDDKKLSEHAQQSLSKSLDDIIREQTPQRGTKKGIVKKAHKRPNPDYDSSTPQYQKFTPVRGATNFVSKGNNNAVIPKRTPAPNDDNKSSSHPFRQTTTLAKKPMQQQRFSEEKKPSGLQGITPQEADAMYKKMARVFQKKMKYN